ncbi:unnamed protein product [Ectocarpus sp. 6 AP-2014]
MGGERTQSGTGDTRAIPQGEEEFVVVDDDGLNLQDSGAEPAGQDAAPFSPGAFPALGASLSAGVAFAPPSFMTQQSQNPRTPSTDAAAAAAAGSAAPDAAAAGAVVAALDLFYKALCAYAIAGYKFLHAHGAVAYNFIYTHAAMAFEFVYAYAAVALHEALGLLETACSWVRSAWQRWQERGPASVKRVVKKRFLPVLVAVALSLLLVLPAYWAIPRGGGGNDDGPERLSARQWQAKYDLLSSKFSADTVRQRLKYDSLAGRHLELQAEYESLLKDYKIQQRANRARSLPKTPPETCSKSDSVLGPAKEALKLAEQSAYEYLSHFAEGLREDVHEVKGLFQRKTRSWLDSLR